MHTVLRVLTDGAVITQITFVPYEHDPQTDPHDPLAPLITQALSAWFDGDVSKLHALPLVSANDTESGPNSRNATQLFSR
ncbi:hypothetical protein [Arcanobacterium phocae]|uniref:hypothetical protein n=1 Tax=Arcanobacterium phocae TaxID=131112 RepID=UPI001560EC9A|nr:hypothetical protein [Arcanobacterium phocae]